jgi:hypothetical protein
MATMKAHTRKPEIFAGDRKKLEGFIRDCDIYVAANTADFTTNNLKTQFILSHIRGGEAESWKEHYYNTVVTPIPGTFTWEAPADLIANLRQNFAREDDVEESLRKLEAMKQGSKTAEEVVNEHRILMARAKLNDSTLQYECSRLNPSLAPHGPREKQHSREPNNHDRCSTCRRERRRHPSHYHHRCIWVVRKSHTIRSDLPRSPCHTTRRLQWKFQISRLQTSCPKRKRTHLAQQQQLFEARSLQRPECYGYRLRRHHHQRHELRRTRGVLEKRTLLQLQATWAYLSRLPQERPSTIDLKCGQRASLLPEQTIVGILKEARCQRNGQVHLRHEQRRTRRTVQRSRERREPQ